VLPEGYTGLLVADTRRAIQWEAGLKTAGFESVRVETRGADVEKGDWQIGVPERKAAKARLFVSSVLAGEEKLPSPPLLSRSGVTALLLIGAVFAAMVAAGLLSSWL